MKKPIWKTKDPTKTDKKLSSSQKASAKAAAKRAGRPYPNLVDNMMAARKK
jgi:ribosomal protein L15E